MASIRHEEFLQNYHFYPNSIEFRVVSSSGLEKLKNLQAFEFNQLINGKFHFEKDRRELLLLNYDLSYKFLEEVENYFIEEYVPNTRVADEVVSNIAGLVVKADLLLKETIKDNPNSFNKEFVEVWDRVHTQSVLWRNLFINKLNGTYESVFTRLVDIVCEHLQYSLAELHEINSLFKGKVEDCIGCSAITINPFCASVRNVFDVCFPSERLDVYKKHFNIKKVRINNFTDNKLPVYLFDSIKAKGLEVDFIKSLTD